MYILIDKSIELIFLILIQFVLVCLLFMIQRSVIFQVLIDYGVILFDLPNLSLIQIGDWSLMNVTTFSLESILLWLQMKNRSS